MSMEQPLGRPQHWKKKHSREKSKSDHDGVPSPPLLYNCVCARNWDAVGRRCDTHPEEVPWQDGEGGTALHAACYLLAPPLVVSSLLSARRHPHGVSSSSDSSDGLGVSVASVRTRQGSTALHIAALRGSSAETIALLAGAYPPAAGWADSGGETPLHLACRRYGGGSGGADVMAALVRAAPHAVSRGDAAGRTPLSLVLDEYRGIVGRAVARMDLVVREGGGRAADVDADADAGATAGGGGDYAGGGVGDQDQSMLRVDGVDVERPSSPRGERSFSVLFADVLSFGAAEGGYYDDRSFADALEECWTKLSLLTRAAYHGTLDDPLPDNQKFRIVHALAGAVVDPPFLRLAAWAHPEQLGEADGDGNLPLHIAAAAAAASSSSSSPGDATPAVGSSGADSDGDDTRRDSSMIRALLDLRPDAASVPDERGRLPLRVALDGAAGASWSAGLGDTLRAYPAALHTCDVHDRAYPTILAQLGAGDHFTVVYLILRTKPDILKLAAEPRRAESRQVSDPPRVVEVEQKCSCCMM